LRLDRPPSRFQLSVSFTTKQSIPDTDLDNH
jgi:hypothetical protein